MKRPILLMLAALWLAACTKQTTNPQIIEPPDEKIISADTLRSGDQWGLAVGMSSTALYAKIQEIKTQRGINGLIIVGNVFSSLESLADRLNLYTSVYLDEQKGTETGIQINFENDQVKSIFLNSGTQLNRWPVNGGNNAVLKGDKLADVYPKLLEIKKNAAYANKFERISIFYKDLNKAYDTQMAASLQWYFRVQTGPKRYNLVQLNLTGGTLATICSTVSEQL